MHKPHDNFILDDYPRGSVTQWMYENEKLYKGLSVGLHGHNGIDTVAPWGSALYAVEDSYVVDVKNDANGYGKHVRLRSTKEYKKGYREWTYGHMANIYVEGGQKVKAGDVLGIMGNTGFVVSGATPFWEYNPYAGTHLHLGLRYLIPNEKGWKHRYDTITYDARDYDNGFLGAFDPVLALSEVDPDGRRVKMLTVFSLLNQVVELFSKFKK